MKNSLLILFLFLTSALSLSGCVRDTAEAIVKEKISTVPPETFLNINIKPRGDIYLVSFPADNRIGYVQFTVTGYSPNKPHELRFYHPTVAIQGDIDKVCIVNNIPQEKLLPLMHGKITSYHKIGVSQVRGINSKPYVAFQYAEEVVLYYAVDLSQDQFESFVTSKKLQVLNKRWLYERHESDILR
ncbi:hypothetical protein [Pontibacter beigongshangensis]|uniref:hypothetical protein n=1 Tax=Pontibacter beigongshangensis TaxID=2574733 RepID=UPI001650A9E6|nr:hypothetical protein [Pontibacter beigongshangensis]